MPVKYRVVFDDAESPGSKIVTTETDILRDFPQCSSVARDILYDGTFHAIPDIDVISLFFEKMDGVAYSTACSQGKEVHFSLGHVLNSSRNNGAAAEIKGVLVHETVHCWQFNGFGTCPGGLIEGIAGMT